MLLTSGLVTDCEVVHESTTCPIRIGILHLHKHMHSASQPRTVTQALSSFSAQPATVTPRSEQ